MRNDGRHSLVGSANRKRLEFTRLNKVNPNRIANKRLHQYYFSKKALHGLVYTLLFLTPLAGCHQAVVAIMGVVLLVFGRRFSGLLFHWTSDTGRLPRSMRIDHIPSLLVSVFV